MDVLLTRRTTLAGLLGAALVPPSALTAGAPALATQLGKIERKVGGRLGVAVLREDGRSVAAHRGDERFPMCSTFKLLLAAGVLARVDKGEERLERGVAYSKDDLVTYSPVTGPRADAGSMTVSELCEAAVTQSDNTAANLLLASVGGPARLTLFLRSLGDSVTRLDRIEPHLNEAAPGDPRDTTSPGAMAATIRALLFGRALSQPSRDRLTLWLRSNRTGNERLRAGLQPGWTAGEKTGSGERGTTNDVGVLWSPRGSALVVAAFLTECSEAPVARNSALAAVASAVIERCGPV